jgi:hypothetical protein
MRGDGKEMENGGKYKNTKDLPQRAYLLQKQ